MKTCNIVAGNELVETLNVSGSGALNTTLTASAAVDNGDGTVKLGVAADLFDAGSMLLIEGTDNYDGIRTVRSVSAGFINIEANFIAETTTTAQTVKVGLKIGHPFELKKFEIHLSSTPTTSENLTLNIDANAGANYDTNVLTKDFSTLPVSSLIWVPTGDLIYEDADDMLRVAWSNSDSRDFGLKLQYRRL